MNLKKPVSELFMIGPTYARRLKRLEIETTEDLLYHFPFRYLDFSLNSPIVSLQPGEIVSIKGEIASFVNQYTKSGKKIQKAEVQDQSGKINIYWFNQPYLAKILQKGYLVNFSGKVDFFGAERALISPEYEIVGKAGISIKKETIHTGRLVPIYHETYGVSSKWLRSRIAPLVKNYVPFIKDFLPLSVLKKYQLEDLNTALAQIHFPKNIQVAENAKKRLSFDEMFLIQMAALQRKASWKQKKLAYKFKLNEEKIETFKQSLPYKLTSAQERCLSEIFSDLKQDEPMNRLLEGDVGSGKTVVAAAAIFFAFLNGVQSALMAPTEILAFQHFQNLTQLLAPLGLKAVLLTGASKIKEIEFDLIIGTHALIYKRAKFNKLGLVVIDEQHRFGVEQRSQLINKATLSNRPKITPHVLTMTATPIPRTVALTLYGDLDLSVLDEMPPGRQVVKTWVVPPQKREAAYNWIEKQIIATKSQAFIICPLIEDSPHETLQSVRSVTSEFERLNKYVFPHLKLGLLHGRLRSREKNAILEKFRKGSLDILVSTPVVEVGIDIPKATIIMIEAADRFGLAQLHQLRGRVGRSNQQSYCLLFTEMHGEQVMIRLKAMERIYVGMKLAELDLQIRGPGELFGTQQHGFFNLRIASFSDIDLIKRTAQAAKEIFEDRKFTPLLKERLKEYIISQTESN